MTTERIQMDNLNNTGLPAEGIDEVGTYVLVQILVTIFSKMPITY